MSDVDKVRNDIISMVKMLDNREVVKLGMLLQSMKADVDVNKGERSKCVMCDNYICKEYKNI